MPARPIPRRTSGPRRHRTVALGVVSIATFGVCVALALLPQSSTTAARRGTRQPGQVFPVLDTPATPGDAVPPEVAASLTNSVDPEFTRADVRGARRILADEPGWLVVAADGELCLFYVLYALADPARGWKYEPPTVAHACVPEGEADAGDLVVAQSLGSSVAASDAARVAGVAPNGVRLVTVRSRRRSVEVPVDRDGYEVVVGEPVAVTFVTVHGGASLKHVIPVGTFSKSAAPQPAPRSAEDDG